MNAAVRLPNPVCVIGVSAIVQHQGWQRAGCEKQADAERQDSYGFPAYFRVRSSIHFLSTSKSMTVLPEGAVV